ncbi:MAG: hypothetical protein IJI21_06535, partial [Clostridia bacterium]|nr:hypothetical protein [Clostridia bacterium]
MLCPKCGYYAEGEEIVCPECGEILRGDSLIPTEGAESIRQGKRAREAALRRPAPPISEKPGKSGASRGAGSATAAKTAEEDPEEMKTYGAAESEEDADRNGGIERKRRNLYDDESIALEQAAVEAARYEKNRKRRRPMVNWMKVAFLSVLVLALVGGAGWFVLNRTEM